MIQIKKDKSWCTLVRSCAISIEEQDFRGICKVWWSFNKLGICSSEPSIEPSEGMMEGSGGASNALLSAALQRTISIADELDAMGVANCLWGIAKAFGDQTDR